VSRWVQVGTYDDGESVDFRVGDKQTSVSLLGLFWILSRTKRKSFFFMVFSLSMHRLTTTTTLLPRYHYYYYSKKTMKFSTLAVFVACAVGRGDAFSAASFKPSFGVQVRLFGILIIFISTRRRKMVFGCENAPQQPLVCSKVWQQSPTAE
jgi:hypothetical protein